MIMLELTSPWEENFCQRRKQKTRKYNQLVLDLEESKHNGVKWNAQLLCVEIGARGVLHEMAWCACVALSVLQKEQERR